MRSCGEDATCATGAKMRYYWQMNIIVAIAAAAVASAAAAEAPAEARLFDCTGQVAVVCGGAPKRLIMMHENENGTYSFNQTFWLADPSLAVPKSGDIVRMPAWLRIPRES